MGEDTSHWSVDKRINISIILTLVVNMLALGVYAGTSNARLNYVEGIVQSYYKDATRLSVLETKLNQIERQLDRLLQRQENQQGAQQ